MSNKVKVVTCLSTTLGPRPKARFRLPISTSAFTSRSHTSSQTRIPDPNLPGCSRWFSTSHSQSTISQRSFFTSNSDTAPSTSTSPFKNTKPIKNANLINDKNLDEVPVNDLEIRDNLIKTPHLPLPTKLPYSPNSYPFKRHLEILSLSIYTSNHPDESWLIYQSLDKSLRSYIPDEIFKSLLLHQLSHQEKPRSWNRIKILLKLAKKCAFSLEKFGSDEIIRILKLAMGRFRVEKDSEKKDEIYKIIRVLWLTLDEIIPLPRIPHELRKAWLNMQYSRLLKLRPRKDGINQIEAIEEIALDMVKKDGVVGLGYYIGQILISSGGSSKGGLQQSLRNLTWCLAKGVDIKLPHLLKVMRKLSHIWSSEGEDGLEQIRGNIPIMLNSLNIDAVSNTSRTLYQALDVAARRSKSRVEKGLELIDSNQPSFGELIGRGISTTISAQIDIIAKLTTAIRLLELALQHKEHNSDALISAITIAMYKARSSPSQEIDKLIIQYVRLLNEAQVISRLPSESIIPLFRLILLPLPSSEAYISSRKIYQYVRSATPPFLWSRKNLPLWQGLFRYSITPPNSHLHFASRLYTDLMADGIPIRRQDMLMLIRAIGSKASPSRAVLLERHIKDYLWASYGSPSPLILALVQGLTKGGIKDTDLALDLAERLSQGKPLQSSVVELIINQLSKSTRKEDRIRIFQLLKQLDVNDESAIKNYNTVLSYLVTSSRRISNEEENKLNHFETLRYSVYLYKEMISKNIKPNSRIISNMIRILIDSNYLNESLSIFNSCIKQNILIKSNSVGRLMINLTIKNRLNEANQVEIDWRELSIKKFGIKNGKIWDKGIIGAKILIDIKSSKKVDIDKIMKETGWKGKIGFLNFLESLKPPSSTGGDQKESEVDSEKEFNLVKGTNEGDDLEVSGEGSRGTSSLFWDSSEIEDRRDRESRKDGIDLCMSSNYNVVYH